MREARKKRRRGRHRFIIFLSLVLLLLAADSRWRIVTDEYTIESRRLPAAFDGFRILQLSDLHGDVFGQYNNHLLEEAAATRPDIIVLTGDLIDEPEDLAVVEALLPRLMVLAPCYYVTGNHEWACQALPELMVLLERCGVVALRNDFLLLEREGASIVLGGVEDPNGWADMIKPDALCRDVRARYPSQYFVLLAHRNYWVEEYPALETDLILCGHAHGGIVRLPGGQGLLGTDRSLFPEHTQGLTRSGDYAMLVSRGLGNVQGTFRLLNNPELVVAELKKIGD